MTRSPVPLLETATNRPLPKVTESQTLSAALTLIVQLIPSGDVMTLLPVPVLATATNRSLPNIIERQLLSAALTLIFQLIPA